jgi:hypothetical protein
MDAPLTLLVKISYELNLDIKNPADKEAQTGKQIKTLRI